VTVLYNENKVRAIAIQQLLEECISYYENIEPAHKFNISTKLLNKKAWEELPYELPYGMPHYNNEGFIIMASDKKAAGELIMGKPDMTPDSVLSPVDGIAIHELGHYYFVTLFKADTTSKWANEFMANYFATVFFRATNKFNSPNEEISTYKPKYRSLKDFEKIYSKMDPLNYVWYQGQFIKLASMLYPKVKMKLFEEFINKDSGMTLLDILKKLAKRETNAWLKEMQ
jgi:hypothetical protein